MFLVISIPLYVLSVIALLVFYYKVVRENLSYDFEESAHGIMDACIIAICCLWALVVVVGLAMLCIIAAVGVVGLGVAAIIKKAITEKDPAESDLSIVFPPVEFETPPVNAPKPVAPPPTPKHVSKEDFGIDA